ncbi:MAG: hypothetical protein IKK77_03830 [Clostridia bacterium]|nr:hypothetical protein [Clostridia bacterium]
MLETKKILVFTVAAWNSKVGANSWATLLQNYDSSNVANICIRDEFPDSDVCSRYFVISENKVIKSFVNRKIKTGFEINKKIVNKEQEDLQEHNKRYQNMKKRRRYSMLLARELVWKFGKWKTKELDEFLDDFKPDIILHSMEGYIHLNRIIEYSIKRTGAKAVGYIWDDNFTYKQSTNVGYKIYRFFQRGSLKRLAKKTNAFFAISNMSKKEADNFFGINSTVLTKPLNCEPVVTYDEIDAPIKLLYTGNLYIGRERSLLKLAKAIKKFPKGSFVMDVYTKTELPYKLLTEIESENCHVHKAIPQKDVFQKQKEADILLFLEDIDGKDAKVARLSFSTKITDYLSTGKCVLAVGNIDTAPMQYFAENDAAIVCENEVSITKSLEKIYDNPEIIKEYAQKAILSAKKNHDPEKIRKVFAEVLMSALKK